MARAHRFGTDRTPSALRGQEHLCAPFRKNLHDRMSTEFLTFGTWTGGSWGSPPPRRGSLETYKRPGSTPSSSTLYLGSGRPYDRAEAARVAAAERQQDEAHLSAYPALRTQRAGRQATRMSTKSSRASSSPVVNLTEGGL